MPRYPVDRRVQQAEADAWTEADREAFTRRLAERIRAEQARDS
ncbi:hypothetical protein [Streptomyces gossypii]|nr:hypothetical protein [Streptomyces gossypii]